MIPATTPVRGNGSATAEDKATLGNLHSDVRILFSNQRDLEARHHEMLGELVRSRNASVGAARAANRAADAAVAAKVAVAKIDDRLLALDSRVVTLETHGVQSDTCNESEAGNGLGPIKRLELPSLADDLFSDITRPGLERADPQWMLQKSIEDRSKLAEERAKNERITAELAAFKSRSERRWKLVTLTFGSGGLLGALAIAWKVVEWLHLFGH